MEQIAYYSNIFVAKHTVTFISRFISRLFRRRHLFLLFSAKPFRKFVLSAVSPVHQNGFRDSALHLAPCYLLVVRYHDIGYQSDSY